MTLANLTLLAAVCSSSARLVPLALLLLADCCEAYGTICDNSVSCSSGCPTGVYGTSLCDGTYTGTEVDLNSQGLSGTIPPQLGDISQLEYLSLSRNSISGTIPPETSKLTKLKNLYLYSNSISGTIAGTICDNSVPCPSGCPTSVYGTSLCDGNYTGTEVSLTNEGLSGTIPPQLGDISQLEYLSLSRNSISGTIPPETSKLSQLEWLDLANNDISGTVPPQLNNLPLTNCDLGGTNHFACPLPALPAACAGLSSPPSSYPPECNY